MNYIETSVGTIEFESELDGCYIGLEHGDHGKTVYHGINPVNPEAFNKFLEMFDFTSMNVVNTVNGPFLKISLSDGYYGSPEYKIYKE